MGFRGLVVAAFLLGLSVSPATAAAQPASDTQPTGGTVVAGSASVGPSTATGIVIKQTSLRAAIDWSSFDVGSDETVQIKAPSTSAATLLRVTGGDAAQIAGAVRSNGVIVLVDSAGAELFPGSVLTGASALLSAPGVSTSNFIVGRLVFDAAANPTAAVVNGGSVATNQAGTAMLLAPGIENTGEITARLGQALLISGQGATISQQDSGDPVQITAPTSQAPAAADGSALPALITQTGTVMAAGGDIQMLTNADAGVSESAIETSGPVAAATVGSTPGNIEVDATGGAIDVDGPLKATGAARELGGAIQVLADSSDPVSLGAQATLDASGAAGGGSIAIGTTTARAIGGSSVTAPESSSVSVPAGAVIQADATKDGNGGHITALSTTETYFAGDAFSRGGPKGGNGGEIELSSADVLELTGQLDVSAAAGNQGTILLDPAIFIS